MNLLLYVISLRSGSCRKELIKFVYCPNAVVHYCFVNEGAHTITKLAATVIVAFDTEDSFSVLRAEHFPEVVHVLKSGLFKSVRNP